MTFAAAVAALGGTLASITPALAETLYCNTSFQGYRICSGPGGYRSTEWDRQGMTFGQDNQGNRWTTSRWRDFETTTVRRPERR